MTTPRTCADLRCALHGEGTLREGSRCPTTGERAYVAPKQRRGTCPACGYRFRMTVHGRMHEHALYSGGERLPPCTGGGRMPMVQP